jgi:hypothetical protein
MKKTFKMEDPQEPKKPNQETSKADTTNYLPIENLPSRYLLYPPVTKILARPLNVKEVKFLATMDSENYNFVISDVLNKATKGIPVDEIETGDKHFIIFWLRANTYRNSGYELDYECLSEKCQGDKRTYNFGLEDLDVEYLKDDNVIPTTMEFPISKDKFVARTKKIKDENKLADFVKRNQTSLTKYDEEILDLASFVKSVNGSEMSLMEKYQYVENMHPEDFSFLISYVDTLLFGVKQNVKAVCGTCKEITPVGVSFRPEFFIPKYKF